MPYHSIPMKNNNNKNTLNSRQPSQPWLNAVSATIPMIILLMLGIIIIAPTTAAATPVIIGKGTTGNASEVVGNRFFKNGTGIAYFNDGLKVLFNHSNTPENGFYYDNTTVFYAGDIPEISSSNNNSSNTSSVSVGVNRNVVIPRQVVGSDDRQAPPPTTTTTTTTTNTTTMTGSTIFQPSVVRIKVDDTVTWINEDYKTHSISSPPLVLDINKNGDIPDFDLFTDNRNFQTGAIESGETLTMQFNNAGGFHYYDPLASGDGNAGTIIVEE
jgi:plastocyanin